MRTLIFVLTLITACQTPENKSQTLESTPNRTQETTYTHVFRELPLAASLSRLPWPSDSWTTVRGGAAFRWQLAAEEETDDLDDLKPFIHYPIGAPLDPKKLSPVEKLDVYLGNTDWALTRKERARTLEQKNQDGTPRGEIPEWEGVMHAWSAASLQFEPVAPTSLQSKTGQAITFEPEDIYSLLTLFVHEQSPKPIVLASICPGAEVGATPGSYAFENDKQSLRRKNCPSINPALFHTVLTNQIGKRNEGFIFDRDLNGEIANNPVVAYESRIIEKPGEKKTGSNQTYHIRTVVFLTSETPVITKEKEDYPYETEAYEYELTVDNEGKIASGRWITPEGSDANQSIPDFLWKASPVWLNGPIKTVYESGRQTFAEQKRSKPIQLRPLEDMPISDRQSINSYFNSPQGTTKF